MAKKTSNTWYNYRNRVIEKIVMKKSLRGKWYWKGVAGNGKCVCYSEEYNTKHGCLKTARAMARQNNVLIFGV